MSTEIKLKSLTELDNSVYVAKNGNDTYGLRNDSGKPFLTIGAAIAASLAGDVIFVSPGTYEEEGLTLAGRSLIGVGGWEHTVLGVPSVSATTHIITLNADSYIQGFGMNVPQTDFAAINCIQPGGTNSIYDISFYGDGGTGTSLGTGIIRQGGGKTIGANIRVEGGGINTVFKNIAGVLALEGIHVPQSQGDIQDVLLVTTDDPKGTAPTVAGRAQFLGFNCGKGDNGPFGAGNGVLNIVRTEGGASGVIPTCLVFTANFFNSTNAVAGTGQYERIEVLGGRFENLAGFSVTLDLFGNAQETVYRISANHQPIYSYNQLNAALSEFSLNFTQEQTDKFTSSYNIFGADQISVGFSERGSDMYVGRGAPYITGMTVFTTDALVTPSTDDGTVFVDVTDEATSRAGSTFGFQTNVANETILIGTSRRDIAGTPLKFFGIESVTATGAPLSDMVCEIWDGAAWVQVNFHTVQEDRGFSYGNSLFWRTADAEHVRVEIDLNTTWAAKTINTVFARWMRFRIITPAASNPAIERIRLLESSSYTSRDGIPAGIGLAMFKKNIALSGPIWTGRAIAGAGALADIEQDIGVGPVYTHYISDSQLNTINDTATIQVNIPLGTCTAFPVNFRLYYSMEGPSTNPITVGSPNQLTCRVTKVKATGTLIADSAGGLVPTKRLFGDSTDLTTAVPVTNVADLVPQGATEGVTTYDTLVDKIHEVELSGNIDISDIYENDILLLQIDFSNNDEAMDINLWSLELFGVAHQDGQSI